MDLRLFYRKIREVEAAIEGAYPIVVSLATPDGGIAGVLSEVSRAAAARQIVEGKVRLANETERRAFLEQFENARRIAERAKFVNRMQIAVFSGNEADEAEPKLDADDVAEESDGE